MSWEAWPQPHEPGSGVGKQLLLLTADELGCPRSSWALVPLEALEQQTSHWQVSRGRSKPREDGWPPAVPPPVVPSRVSASRASSFPVTNLCATPEALIFLLCS